MHPSQSLFMELPTELLNHIFDFYDVGDEFLEASYNLAQTCKRFHTILLPRFLARFHISEPAEYSELVFVRQKSFTVIDALSGLQLSFLTSVKDLVCRFQVPRGETEVEIVIMHLRRLYFFISSLQSVDSVTMFFAEGDSECGCCLGFRQGETLDWMLEEWSVTMGRTLSKILEQGCQSLTIYGGKYMLHSYFYKRGKRASRKPRVISRDEDRSPFAKMKSFIGRKRTSSRSPTSSQLSQPTSNTSITNVLIGDRWEFSRATGTGSAIVLAQLSEAANTHSALRSLTIQSRMMLVPPTLQLVVDILQLPTLESLTISNMSMHKKFWPSIFTLIAESAGPHLKHLHISCIRKVLASELLAFLSCFPQLVSLHLANDIQHLDQFDAGPFPDFPYLQTLHAPAPWVFKLLDAQKGGLARLESLELVYNLRNDGLSHWIRRPKTVSIPMLLSLDPGPGRDRRPLLTISVRVYLGKGSGAKMMEDVEAEIEAEAREYARDRGVSRQISGTETLHGLDEMTLVINDELEKKGAHLEEMLGEWVELFKGLRVLDVVTMPPRSITHEEAVGLVTRTMHNGGMGSVKAVSVNGVLLGLEE